MKDVPGERIDALVLAEMARRAEELGIQKASMDGPTTLALAVLAGAFIALGGVFATTALAGAGATPWGVTRVLAGVTFSLGLILVMVGGALLPVTIGNMVGGTLLVGLMYWFVYLRRRGP